MLDADKEIKLYSEFTYSLRRGLGLIIVAITITKYSIIVIVIIVITLIKLIYELIIIASRTIKFLGQSLIIVDANELIIVIVAIIS